MPLGIITFLAAVYACVLALLSWKQTRLIFPGSFEHDIDHDRVIPSMAGALVESPDGGVIGLFEPALDVDGRPVADVRDAPTLIYFYGNGSSMKESESTVGRFRKDGVNVFIAEYPGYGMNAGEPTEVGCYATADAAY